MHLSIDAPRAGDEACDAIIDRAVYLRRTAGPSRVTVYEGGHDMHAEAAFDAHMKR